MSDATGATRQAASLLFLHAQTSLHPGSGTALGTIDLPVQRERHTLWPTIPGSALKGILRDAVRERTARASYSGDRRRANEEDRELTAVFGPGKVDESSSHAGALSVTDARILAFPVRSLRGVFAWVTCREVVRRLNRDLALVGQAGLAPPPEVRRNEALCPKGSPLLLDGSSIVLEEFEFRVKGEPGVVAGWTASSVGDERVHQHMVVLSDDDFTYFVRHATEVVARVGLDYERKTVKDGALFYQEFLPAETLFYAVLLASASRYRERPWMAAEVLGHVAGHLRAVKYLQVGGDETTGKGLCAVRLPESVKEGQS
jgi:CRISPR-associated protein Cmr4